MSARFERAIQEWYTSARTANLEHLDLSGLEKPKLRDINHNLDVVYDRLLLHSKVAIADYYKLHEQLKLQQEEFQNSLANIHTRLTAIEHQLEHNKPLTAQEVQRLVQTISEHPKRVEQEALLLTENLGKQVQEVKDLIHHLRETIIG